MKRYASEAERVCYGFLSLHLRGKTDSGVLRGDGLEAHGYTLLSYGVPLATVQNGKVTEFNLCDSVAYTCHRKALEEAMHMIDDFNPDINFAYECPSCGSHDCEFEDAEDFPEEGYFDGAHIMANYFCNRCGREYSVKFTLNAEKTERDSK